MIKKIFLTFILLLLPLTTYALEDNFIITCDNNKLKINDQFICRVSVDANVEYDKINYTIVNSEGIETVDIRSNYDKIWSVTEVGATSKELRTGLSEFGIFLLKASSSGEKIIEIKDISLENTKTETIKKIDNVDTKIKVISEDNTLKDIIINNKSLDGFEPKKKTYEILLDKEKEIKIDVLKNDEFCTVDGNTIYKITNNQNEAIIPIKVLSESGNSNIYLLKFIRKNVSINDNNKNLESLLIKNSKGNSIIFNFNPSVYEYLIEVDDDISYLDINPSLSSDDVSFVKGYGKQKLELHPGDNVALIKVVDKEGQMVNYTLNITKPLRNKSDNNFLKSINIERYQLEFNKRVKRYNLNISKKDKSLNIKPVLDDSKATYEIIGNNGLKKGSVIKIIVTAENQTKNTYQINIDIISFNYVKLVIIIVAIIALIYGLYKFIKLKKNAKKKSKKSSKRTATNTTRKKRTNKKTNKKSNNNNKSKKKPKKNKNKMN